MGIALSKLSLGIQFINVLYVKWLARGQRLRELFKQSQLAPFTMTGQINTIYTRTNGYLDSVKIGQVKKFLVKLCT